MKEVIKIITKGRIQVSAEWRLICPRQVKDKFKGPYYTHCRKCIFNVCQTKAGACLVFKWKHRKRQEILTIDLVPVLPVIETSIMELFTLAIKTLVEDRPPNWLTHTKGIVTQDSILPESYCLKTERCATQPIQVGLKLLNYGQEQNFIIRPAQILGITNRIQDKKLMDVYSCIKCLKVVFNLKISYYLIK